MPVPLGVGLLFWGLSLFFTIALSLLLAGVLRTRRASLDTAIALFIWILVTTTITFAFGLAGLLSAKALGIASVVGLLVLLGFRRTRESLLELWRGREAIRSGIASQWSGLPLWLRWVSAIFLGYHAVRFVFLIWALPPFIWDSLTYHLTNVAQWVQDGRIGLFIAPVQRIYSPANYEVLAAWFTVFVHHDVVIEAAGLPAYALAGLSVYAIGRGIRLSGVGSWVATLAFLSTPGLVYAVTGTKNDPFLAAVFLLMVALIVHLKENLQASVQAPVLPYAVVLVLGLAYALGTKAYILQLAVGLLVLVLIPDRSLGFWSLWRRGLQQLGADWRAKSSGARAAILALVACAFVIGGYWNLRNWLLTGNPFYPYEVAVETAGAPGTGSGHYGFGLGRLEENIRSLGWKLGDKQARVVPDLPDTTGWGWVAYGMGLVATAWAVVVNRRFRILALAFGVSLVMVMASNTTSRWNMRYFIWLPALLALGIGAFLDPMATLAVAQRRVLGVLLVFGLAMNSVMVLNYNLVSMDAIADMMALPVRDRDAGRLPVRVPNEYTFAYEFVPRDDVLGYNVHENGFIYPLFRADFSQRLIYVPVTPEDSCEEIATTLEALGTRYLFVAPEHTDDNLILQLRQCASTDSPIRERAGGLYVVKRDGG